VNNRDEARFKKILRVTVRMKEIVLHRKNKQKPKRK